MPRISLFACKTMIAELPYHVIARLPSGAVAISWEEATT